MADDHRERGINLISPARHLDDLTPSGGGDWCTSVNYYRDGLAEWQSGQASFNRTRGDRCSVLLMDRRAVLVPKSACVFEV
jgi:hypothetical protein